MSKQELDLFEIAAGFPAELGAGTAEVVGTEVLDPDFAGGLLDDVPDGPIAEASTYFAALADLPQQRSLFDPCSCLPGVDGVLDPERDRDGADAAALATEVGDDPAVLAQLDLGDVKCGQFTSAQRAAEVELIGQEGVVGALHLLGSAPVQTKSFIQLAGTGLRINLAELRRAFQTSDEIRTRLLELVQAQALTVSQMTGCNRLHEAEARLARWLLMAQDRTQSDVLHLTQEFLAEMLGTQRTTVTSVAGSLQRSGLIEYQQGRVRIPDTALLETAACECYGVAKALHKNLYSKTI